LILRSAELLLKFNLNKQSSGNNRGPFMCIILFAYKVHPRYPLVMAANRDEFYDRPTIPAAFRQNTPDLLAGRDLRHGGTWLGMTRTGKIAALANHRTPRSFRTTALSRGYLVRDFLLSEDSKDVYLERLKREANLYKGYSLIFGDMGCLYYFSNRSMVAEEIPPGIHGQSNDLLDTPWPKVQRGKEALWKILSAATGPSPEALFTMLADRTVADDKLLPDTGVGIEQERLLAPIFVKGSIYGTRSSTLAIVDSENNTTFIERTYNGNQEVYTTLEYRFKFEY
jgi:uncharacterized protein with NRDE domain